MLNVNSTQRSVLAYSSSQVAGKLVLEECCEIKIPILPIQNIASSGVMALSKARENIVYGRGIPENTIFRARLNTPGELGLDNFELVVSKDDFPITSDGSKVSGYEDPTFIDKEINPFFYGEDGILCSQTYRLNTSNKLEVNLVYIGLNIDGKATHIQTVLTPKSLVEAKIVKTADMVKEGEIFVQKDGRIYLLFEYGGSDNGKDFTSNISIAEIKNGMIHSIAKFYTAGEDNSEHLSTDSNPIQLIDDTNLLFFNRRRNNEWGVTYLLFGDNFQIIFVCPDFLVRAPTNIGLGPNAQLIAFTSQVVNHNNESIEVFYHVNDERPYYTVAKIGEQTNLK